MRLTDLVRYTFHLSTETYQYRAPMKFGGRVVSDVTLLNVRCDGELRDGKQAVGTRCGFGSMTMGVVWAWPTPTQPEIDKLAVLVTLANRLAEALMSAQIAGHPLEICHGFAVIRDRLAIELGDELSLSTPIPPLAVLLAASPIEAALFDAHGKAFGMSSFALLGRDFVNFDLSHYLGSQYAGRYLDESIAARPAPSMPLYHLVGALDVLDDAELRRPVGDGLPETLAAWIARDGLTHLKIKLAGDAFDWDVERVVGIHRVATAASPQTRWTYSLDFNERCESAKYVLELIDALAAKAPAALESIAYIEQPTHRDLASHPENVMHEVARRLPVVIDESLVDLASLRLAVEQGYSGVALKACKGHSEALLMAALATHENLYLCVQDLTCVGASLLHSASLAAHIPRVMAIESNGRQYCPAANDPWRALYPGMFDVRDGCLPTAGLDGHGLGYQ